MGDEVVFFKEGYQKYLVAVREKQVYDVGPRCEPYEKFNLQVNTQQHGVVIYTVIIHPIFKNFVLMIILFCRSHN